MKNCPRFGTRACGVRLKPIRSFLLPAGSAEVRANHPYCYFPVCLCRTQCKFIEYPRLYPQPPKHE